MKQQLIQVENMFLLSHHNMLLCCDKTQLSDKIRHAEAQWEWYSKINVPHTINKECLHIVKGFTVIKPVHNFLK